MNEVKGEIRSITDLATRIALNSAENKMPSVSNLVKKTRKLIKLKRTFLIIIIRNILLLKKLIS